MTRGKGKAVVEDSYTRAFVGDGDISPSHRVIVTVTKGGREVVTLQAHNGAGLVVGSCAGRWEPGLMCRGIPSESRVAYLRDKFGPLKGLKATDFRILDRLYREIVEDMESAEWRVRDEH